jgi:hypothetical protein
LFPRSEAGLSPVEAAVNSSSPNPQKGAAGRLPLPLNSRPKILRAPNVESHATEPRPFLPFLWAGP